MSLKQIGAMKTLLSETFDKIQSLHIQATRENVNILAESLSNLQTVYNTLDLMAKECESQDGTKAVNE